MDTTVDPGRMFGGRSQTRSIMPASKTSICDDSGKDARAVIGDVSLPGIGHGDPKPFIEIGRAVDDKSRRVSFVRMERPTRFTSTCKSGANVENSGNPRYDDDAL